MNYILHDFFLIAFSAIIFIRIPIQINTDYNTDCSGRANGGVLNLDC